MTTRVRQACNHTSVVSNSVRQDRRVEEGQTRDYNHGSQGPRTWRGSSTCSTETATRTAGGRTAALCAQTDPEAFFPEKGGSTREAKRVCLTCDVRQECLEYALANDERFGIWGGLSERERRKLKKRAV